MRKRVILHRHLRYTGWYIRLVSFLKSIKLRGGQTSLYRILIIFIDKVGDNQLFEKAYGVAFNFTLSLFPAIIFLFALIPFIHEFIPSVSQGEILHFLQDILPKSVFDVTATTIYDTVQIRREGLMSFGVLFALFLATNGVNSLMKTFNMSYKTVENRSFIKTRWIALLLTLLLAFALIMAIVLLLVGQIVLNWLIDIGILSEDFLYYLIIVLRFVVIFIAFYLAIASIYYWGPAIHDKWRFFSMGSILATLLCVLVSFGFSLYVANFGTYNKVYGSIGTIIALMVWQWLMSFILLLGFEFNASMDRACKAEVYDLDED
ncbi:YihY/virulence factor BrkB family protein [Marinoscillum furvescens]|uniref:Membrane protein n=1 Tax=Marinoscillum furvescens DSM 4134 TaxID=1122208 RepID=A0A3D9L6N2_MARFU|nr:YihY/virulence factor BrkB family protein [Marinoscillum furvescens]RED99828.1 membrane protein [Marinoscillum furvescens DSM 4134]